MSDIAYLLTWRPFQESNVFEFKDPDSGRIHKTNSREELIKLIKAYRHQNDYEEIENLEMVVDNYLCSLPQNAGKCKPYFPLKRGFLATMKGGVALIQSLLYKSFVPQSVADVRSKICKSCPYNEFPDKGRFIRWSDSIAEASVGNRRSKYHNELGNCAICSCPLRAKVHYGGSIELPEDQKEAMRKVNCWQVN